MGENDVPETTATDDNSHGGKRAGAGRKAGGQNKATVLRKAAEEALQIRILARADEIISHQLQLSRGHSYLFRIDKDEKGRKQKPELVTDPDEIIKYLAREEQTEGQDYIDPDSYYYITTEKPDNRAIDSMLDRVFGKAVNRTELMGKGGKELKGTVVYLPQTAESQRSGYEEDDGNSVETTSETGESIS